ncbi:pentapeptide repeat-containing protein [Streptomyces sp. SD15]
MGNRLAVPDRPSGMTSATPEVPSSTPPNWPHCGREATQEDPVGCRGIHVSGHTACLAHLDEGGRAAYLAALSPGADIDHRGTPFTAGLLTELLAALQDPAANRPRLGIARLDEAEFAQTAPFHEAYFSGDAWFIGARFSGPAWFIGARFSGTAWFDGARFSGTARFIGARFIGPGRFIGARFCAAARFNEARFSSAARFDTARFEVPFSFGPLVCAQTLGMTGTAFTSPMIIEAAAARVECTRAWWSSTVTLRLRYADLDLTDAAVEYPLTVIARTAPFTNSRGRSLPEPEFSGNDPRVRLTSVNGVDAAHLALHDIDLSTCRFAGAIHLDQLRVDGWCTFGSTPIGTQWYRHFAWRWSTRRTLVEEHYWRAQNVRPALTRGWLLPSEGTTVLKPTALAVLYRQLRKSLEDDKNEPGAADFYYGECEMRRRDTDGSSLAERALLTTYWALSGYGLRATRALVWLLLIVSE